MNKFKPVVLVILDGWGLSPSWGGNALTMNNPRNIDRLWREYPHCVLQALGAIADGLPVCDSRLGHTLIGSGRHVHSNLSRINQTIKSKKFYSNQVLTGAIDWAQKNNSNLHLVGLISEGGVHSHIDHLLSLLNLAHQKNFQKVYIHAITDGTDSGPTDALRFIEKIQNKIDELGIGSFASVAGRNFAMDRDKHWDKVTDYYKMLSANEEVKFPIHKSIGQAITLNYRKGINDEFIPPSLIAQKDGSVVKIKNDDAVIMFNFREDRSRELARIFADENFRLGFWRPKKIVDLYFATFVDYQKDIPAKIAFPDKQYEKTLSEIFASMDLKQLKVAETEKYAHVTYFFNGGNENAFPWEERIIIPSPVTDSYDKTPEMSAKKLTANVVKAIKSLKYDLIVVNYANVDVVAHTGNIVAVGQAVRSLDEAVGQIAEANLKVNGATLITADHGNAEQMVNVKQYNGSDRETFHTLNPVPFILVTKDNRKDFLQNVFTPESNALSRILEAKNTLADVAPTILELSGIPKPPEMTGHTLLNNLE